MKEALLYEKLPDKKVKCVLCNHNCVINKAKKGICAVRENRDGILYSLVYARPIALHIDPIEKKPFFNFHPGSRAFSIATVGCNFSCLNCQNADISQFPKHKGEIVGEEVLPEEVVSKAIEHDCSSISYTYTEPTVFFEYAYDTAKIARSKGLKNTFVTNGYMSGKCLDMISSCLDAANVDLKSFSDKFYKKFCGGKLDPVLENLKHMKKLGIWVEVTTLIVPTLNDSFEELKNIAEFIVSLGPETPWHVTAFYPAYKMTDLPETPPELLHRARKTGIDAGLLYVYSGNIPGDEGENTYCSKCGKLIIRRFGFKVIEYNIENSCCSFCNNKIDGVGI